MGELTIDDVRRTERLLAVIEGFSEADVEAFIPQLLFFAARSGAELSHEQLEALGNLARSIGFEDSWTEEQCLKGIDDYFAQRPVNPALKVGFEQFVRSELVDLGSSRAANDLWASTLGDVRRQAQQDAPSGDSVRAGPLARFRLRGI